MNETFTTDDGVTYPTPEITEGLLAYFRTYFSVERFKGAKTERDLYNLQGQFFVIDHLSALHEQQNQPKE